LPIPGNQPGNRAVRLEQFTTDSFALQQRPHAWRDALHVHQLRPETALVQAQAAPLYGTLTALRTARGVGMGRITSSPQTIRRLGDAADAI